MNRRATWRETISHFFRLINNRRPRRHSWQLLAQRPVLFAIAIAAALVGALIWYVDIEYLAAINEGAFRVGWLQTAAAFTTDLGRSHWYLLATGLPLLALSFRASRIENLSHRLAIFDRSVKLYYLFTSIAFSGLLALLLKNLIGRARPSVAPIDTIWISVPFADKYHYASFPSGHSTTAGALMMGLFLLFPKWRWLFLAAALWIASTRVILGVHFPSDAVAGLLFGMFFSLWYAWLFMQKRLIFKPGVSLFPQLRRQGPNFALMHGHRFENS